MLRALLHVQEPGRICDVVHPGQEFEVHENFSWVDVPDGTTTVDTYDTTNNSIIKYDPMTVDGFAERAYLIARTLEYKDPGYQLDMLYHELRTTGTISNTGPWATHITNVKTNIPKDDPAAVYAWNQARWAEMQGNTSQ